MNGLHVFLALVTIVLLVRGVIALIIGIVTGNVAAVIEGVVELALAVAIGNGNRILQERAIGKARYHGSG